MLTDRGKRPETGAAILATPATPATSTTPAAPATPTAPAAPATPTAPARPATPATPATPTAPATPGSHAAPRARAKPGVARLANLPYALVLAATVAGLGWTSLGPRHVVPGVLAVASAVLVAAVLRLAVPDRRAGLLLSRRRVFDVLVLAALGASILAVVLVLPAPA